MLKPDAQSARLHPPPIPLTFRQELIPSIFRAIGASRSCALVGVTGVGMSNLLRFVCQPRVVASHLEGDASCTLMVFLEGALLRDASDVYRSIARQIAQSARRFGWPRADRAALEHLADRASDAEDSLAEIIAYVCENKQCRAVVAFDEFDAAFVELPATCLRILRRLRDDHKDRLSYLVGTRREMTHLVDRRRPDDADVGKFTELFDLHTFPVKPYGRQDALELIARKASESEQRLDEEQFERLYRATGGHAKLLVAGLTVLVDRRHLPWPNVERALLDNPVSADLCRAMWDDLDTGERAALIGLARDQRDEVQAGDLELLRLKGLAIGRPDSIFSTLFESFVKQYAEESPPKHEQPARSPRRSSRLRDPQEPVRW